MDFVTHTLAGYTLSQTRLNRLSPRATVILILAANAPDIDLVSLFGGDQLALEFHRGITHSVFSLPLMALVPLAVVAIFARGGIRWRGAWVLSSIGVAGHLLLDWTGVYGARLLSPISDRWFHLDAVGETDLVICGILVLVAGWLFLTRLVSKEIGAGANGGKGAALIALALVSAWVGARSVLHERALSALDARLYSSTIPLRVAAFPHYANPFRWRGLAETDEAYHVVELNLRDGDFDPSRGLQLYKAEPSEAIDAAGESEPFVKFLAFSRYPLWTDGLSQEGDGARQVQVVDLSFALPGEDRFAATAIVDPNQQVLRSWFQY